ncbi:hypothetical protein P691DRAFT_760389 [Macrolepiota fuliginosa MF-IS2]|uniref:DUF6535 domain-containing protein n=1 Tax=Macrolepiota fuliginosa MF-IS2 TaxID=1400762 RepID=A0A9P6C0Y2_9AGAR|nr:hypothetical protein P691DRAFT_760389 [Macrolepiota fuliginosa MF-IS2]
MISTHDGNIFVPSGALVSSSELSQIPDTTLVHDARSDVTVSKHAIIQRPESRSSSSSSNSKEWLPNTPYKYPVPGRGEHWQTCHRLVQEYDKTLCGMWTEEVDKLLIFAGLFSGVVTAFIIESYQWLNLKPDPIDSANLLLSRIYAQLSGNESVIPLSSIPSPNNEARWLSSAERINICWFLSLTLSLATVLIGILCMQWLREYRHEAALPHVESISLRQMRFEGLVTWKVPDILSSLPLILQIALVLFFVGILDLLWSLNHRVAIPITIVVGILLIFLFATTLLPTFQLLWSGGHYLRVFQCAYKSPQSWIFCRLTLLIVWCLKSIPKNTKLPWSFDSFIHCRSWNDYDAVWQTARRKGEYQKQERRDDLSAGLTWITQNFKQSTDAMHVLHHCLQDVPLSTAARVVSSLDSRVEEPLGSTFKPQVLRSYTGERRFLEPHSELKRDLVMAYFHELHQLIHPESAVYQLEHIVRVMKASRHWRQRPYLQWPVQDIHAYPEDLAYEFLDCLVTGFQNSHVFTRSEILGTWKIIQDLSRSLNERNHSSGATKVVLMSALLGQLTQWLNSPSSHISLNRAERVRLCVQGLINLFFPWPSMTMGRLKLFHQNIAIVHRMMKSVNDLLAELDCAGTTAIPILESPRRDGWSSLCRQLEVTLEGKTGL